MTGGQSSNLDYSCFPRHSSLSTTVLSSFPSLYTSPQVQLIYIPGLHSNTLFSALQMFPPRTAIVLLPNADRVAVISTRPCVSC